MTFVEQLQFAEEHLRTHDDKLAALIPLFGPCDLQPHDNHYVQLIRSIIGQQLSVKAASSIWQRVVGLFDSKTPTPEQLLGAADDELRACGLSRAKVVYVKDLASHILDGRLDLKHVSSMPNEQLIEQLVAIKGIGEWSAHMFMIFSLGRLDVLPVGDLGVRKAMMNVYGLKELPDPAMCVTIANKYKWHPYESVAAWYMWASLDNAPK